MKIGLPREIKRDEYRVALTPGAVEALSEAGHLVMVEKGAGLGAGIPDEDYEKAGARLASSAGEVWAKAEMIVKVKEPLRSEFPLLRKGQILFGFLHLAASRPLARALLRREVYGVAFETVSSPDGVLPILQPMSEIAGRMAVQEGAKYLEKNAGGRGVLLAGAPGVPRGNVVILGAGIVGKNAAKIAVGMHAGVTVFDINHARLEYIDDIFDGRVKTLVSTRFAVREAVREADLVIGAVLVPGARAPVLVPREMLGEMNPGSVVVDVAVDQGGCVETIRPTYHSRPTYVVDGIVHYGVANMPGAVPRTSAVALSNAVLPYALELANLGLKEAVTRNPRLADGLNAAEGRITHAGVAKALGMKRARAEEIFCEIPPGV